VGRPSGGPPSPFARFTVLTARGRHRCTAPRPPPTTGTATARAPHRGRPRTSYDAPGYHCLTSCASQPITLLAPQINAAVFLDWHDVLWQVPGLEPGHWDWRAAAPIGTGHPLDATVGLITDLLRETHDVLLSYGQRL
jgi:hypothetical protein